MLRFKWFLLSLMYCVFSCSNPLFSQLQEMGNLSGQDQISPDRSYCETTQEVTDLKAAGYHITSEGDIWSAKWGEYLYRHLSNRSSDPLKVIKGDEFSSPMGYRQIHLEIDPEFPSDYCFMNSNMRLHVRVKDEHTMLWVIYQLMERIGQLDSNYEVSDLPPALLQFENTCKDFDFAYREPHLSPNMDVEYAGIIGANQLERDWGLWGHNLDKIVIKDPQLYASIAGIRSMDQYCFSSPELYEQLSQFVMDQYGEGRVKTHWFMVAPNDNDLVCTCVSCTELGNTPDNATPGVGYLLNKLGEAFPEHQFFTLAYRSSKEAPSTKWVDNVGVFLTTIDLPKGVDLAGSPQLKAWEKDLHKWKTQVSQIYLWDYISNFDDYLTPLPILKGFQLQLGAYQRLGIKGLFLNGSGYDYSPFDDVKTYVLSALMMDSDLDIEWLTRQYFKKYYPESFHLLTAYFLSLERSVEVNRKPFPMYGSFSSIENTYLDKDSFLEFYEALSLVIPYATPQESRKLEQLLVALSYTRLQIAYHEEGIPAERVLAPLKKKVSEYLERLSQYRNYPDMRVYRETNGSIASYLKQWKTLEQYSSNENLVLQGGITFLSPADEGYEDSRPLFDGLSGFSSNYHHGWVINSGAVWEMAVEIKEPAAGALFEMDFLNKPRHHILPPEKLEIIVEGEVRYTLTPELNKDNKSVATVRGKIDLRHEDTHLVVRVFRNKEQKRSTLASDEVKILKQ